jgi:phospholipase C
VRLFTRGAVFVAALSLAACNSGTSNTSLAPNPVATLPNTASPATSISVPATAGTLSLPTAGGNTPAVSVAAGAPAGLTVAATASVSAPANAPAPSSAARSTSSVTGASPFLYVTLQFSATVQTSLLTSESVTLANGPQTGFSYYVEIDDITSAPATKVVSIGPGTVSGSTVTIANPTKGNAAFPNLLAGHTYVLQYYATSAAQGQQVAGSPLAHVIVVTMENRTPDNLFGSSALTGGAPYPGADVKNLGGGFVGLEDSRDVGHSYPELVAEWDGGKMDGFPNADIYPLGSSTAIHTPANFANSVVTPTETYIYHALAYQYAFADRMFSSRLAPSFPGHLYLVAGQSVADDDPNSSQWGCDEPAGTSVPTFGTPETSGASVFPCFDYQTIGDQMDAAGITWKYYSGVPGTIDGNIDAYGAIKHIRYGADFSTKVTNYDQIDSDLINCNLPSVSYVNAPAFASDHAATLSAGGPGFVGDLYLELQETHTAANANCNYAANTVMIVTWDDSGGWADHVTPPVDSTGASYGMRVPMIVMSPYTVSGYTSAKPSGYLPFVSHVQHDFGSIIRFIQTNFGMTPGGLGQRDATADNLSDMFNYKQTPVPPLAGILLQDFQRRVQTAKAEYGKMPAGTPVDDDK